MPLYPYLISENTLPTLSVDNPDESPADGLLALLCNDPKYPKDAALKNYIHQVF